MGLFGKGKEETIFDLQNDFPVYAGDCNSGKKIIDSKFIINERHFNLYYKCVPELIEQAKERGYHAITNVQLQTDGGYSFAYGNMVKFG